MALVNEHFLKLQSSYLFSDIAKKVNSFKVTHPREKIIRMGIGDVTQPLPPAAIEAMHKAVEELAHNVPNIIGMKDTSGDITQTSEFIRRTRDVDFKVFGGKDTLLYASLCHGAVGGVCTAANFMPELITDVYNKYAAGDLAGSLEAQFKLNPVRLSMDAASFPVAAKDMANLRGNDVGVPYLPTLPTPEGPAKQGFIKAMTEAGLL